MDGSASPLLPDLDRAAARLLTACAAGEPIGICGDFDVDGLTGTAILASVIRTLGGRPVPYIPHREQDGHGVSLLAISAFRDAGVNLMVTVDTGTNAAAEIAAARAAGIETIVTDHHLPAASAANGGWARPAAYAVVNPHLNGADGASPCGAGVALLVALAMCESAGVEPPPEVHVLAALGTIADGASLRGWNRALVRHGLDALGKTRHPGLRALLAISRPSGAGARPDTEFVSYYVAPRLNAPGRLGDAGPSLRLLMTSDPDEADALAARLDALNTERQRLAQVAWDAAGKWLANSPPDGHPMVVVRCDSVPPGLLGPLAGKLCDVYGRPAVALGMADGGVRASARSTPGFDVHNAVAAHAPLLERFGGHARAAGFTVRPENLEAVLAGIERLAAWAAMNGEARAAIEADAEVRVEDLGVGMWEFVSLMAPFGEGNPAPVLVARRVQPLQVKTMGATGRHLRMTVEDNGRSVDAIGFGLGAAELGRGRVDIAFGLRTDTWNGRLRRELDLKAIRPASG